MQIEFEEDITQWIDWSSDKLELKKDAPKDIKKEFNKIMNEVNSMY